MPRVECHYSIGVVERDTGIGRDTLRIWERRYGFPKPLRNEKNERSYSEIQLRRLQRIRRLLDQGLRPGKLVPLSEDALDELENGLAAQQPEQIGQAVNALLDAVCSGDARRVEALCREQYDALGMKEFILQTLAPHDIVTRQYYGKSVRAMTHVLYPRFNQLDIPIGHRPCCTSADGCLCKKSRVSPEDCGRHPCVYAKCEQSG